MATWQDLYECIVCNNSIDCFIREHHLKPSRLKKLMRSKNLLEALEVRRAAGVLMAYANAGSSAASAVWRLDQLLVGHTAGPETARKAAMAVIKLAQDAKGYIETLLSASRGAAGERLPIANCPLPIEQPQPAGSANGGCRGLRSAAEQPRSTTEAEPGAAESGRPRVEPPNPPSPYPLPSRERGEEATEEAQIADLCYQEDIRRRRTNSAAVAPEIPVPAPSRTFPSVPPRSAPFRCVPKLNRGRAEIMTRKLLHRLGLQDLSSTGVVCLVTGNEKSDSGTIREPRHQEAPVENLCYQEARQTPVAPGQLAKLDISQFPPDREALLRIAKAGDNSKDVPGGDNNNDGRGAAKVESPPAFVAEAELVRPQK